MEPGCYLETALNRLCYPVRSAVRWRRGAPALTGELLNPTWQAHPEAARAAAQYRWHACPQPLDRQRVREWLQYAALLEWALEGISLPDTIRWLDVGAKNDSYLAGLLHALAHRPDGRRRVTGVGVEVDAYRVYRDLRSRADYAAAYCAGYDNLSFVAGDVRDLSEPADVVTWFLPFVVPGPLVAWGLPLSLFSPAALLAHVWSLLAPGGVLLIADQGEREWAVQMRLLQQQGIPVHRRALLQPGYRPEVTQPYGCTCCPKPLA